MKYLISVKNDTIKCRITLPASKSISNRVLIINALSYSPYPVRNLSVSDDTVVMANVLSSNSNKFDIGHAGTAMRFLTAFLAKIAGSWDITGSDRMKQRPIGILVDALRKLGAKIEYSGEEGFPPLRILGTHLTGGSIELDGSISSQYITALLLIAPTLEGGLSLCLQNRITSGAYIKMTLELMAHFGIHYSWEGNTIKIPEQSYIQKDFTVEADWSGASYWFLIAALAKKAEIELDNLTLKSFQGDAIISEWFKDFGILTEKSEGGLRLVKTVSKKPQMLKLDFVENPDLAQTMAALCVAEKVPFHFYGLHTLKIKETDRIEALQKELGKFGAILVESGNGELSWDGTINRTHVQPNPVISTYNDHRMAMALAPMAFTENKVLIENPLVVTKSYPGYWDDLKRAGVEVEEKN